MVLGSVGNIKSIHICMEWIVSWGGLRANNSFLSQDHCHLASILYKLEIVQLDFYLISHCFLPQTLFLYGNLCINGINY